MPLQKVTDLTEIDALILCGGLGKRLSSLVKDRPKVLAEIDNQPFLAILLEYLKIYGIKRVILCAGYLGTQIHSFSANIHDLTIEIAQETKPLGTGGAIKNAESFVKKTPFLVLNGDSICKVDLNALLKQHIQKKAELTITVNESTEKCSYGQIIFDENMRIINFQEKTENLEHSWINSGVYVFEKKVLFSIPENKQYSLEYELFTNDKLIKYAYLTKEPCFDIGTPERLNRYKQVYKKLRSV